MTKLKGFYKKIEPSQIELEEIARLIKAGFTNGRLDNEDGRTFYWELKIHSWEKGDKEVR